MSDFEKWYKEKYYKYDLYPKYAQFRKEMKEVWQAATAESDKRVAELLRDYKAQSDFDEEMIKIDTKTITELQAHINVLRENLDHAYYEVNTHFARNIKDLLASTPAQSLQEHDNEVIEKCAEVCDDRAKYMKEMIMQDVVVGKADTGAMVCADAIRALIEKE